jgi:hypothetical protein
LRNADFRLIAKESIKTRFIIVLPNPKFEIRNPKLLNYSIRSRQHIRRNRLAIFDFRFWILDCSIIG